MRISDWSSDVCSSDLTACPSFWWNPDKFVGPAGLLQAYRFIVDSRDEATGARLDNLEDPYRLFRCHTIMNCADVCPKGLNTSDAMGKIKELLSSEERCSGKECGSTFKNGWVRERYKKNITYYTE